jgi:hypothetical protein
MGRLKGECLTWDVNPRRRSSITVSSRHVFPEGPTSCGNDGRFEWFTTSRNSTRLGRGAYCGAALVVFLGDRIASGFTVPLGLLGDGLGLEESLALGESMKSLTGKKIPEDISWVRVLVLSRVSL